MHDYERTKKTSWLKRIFSTDDSYEYENIEDERLYPTEANNEQPNESMTSEQTTEEAANQEKPSYEQEEQTETNKPFDHLFDKGKDEILMKDDQDKVTLDSIIALENLLKDRQLILHGYKNLKEKLKIATDEIDQAKNENEHQKVLINEKDRIIQKREQDIAEQQMIYDQLLEDYRLFKQNSQEELSSFTDELDRLNKNYHRLMKESTKEQSDHLSKIALLEEKIRTLEIENETYQTKYDQMYQEKNRLMEKVDHFTRQIEQMSMTFIDQQIIETETNNIASNDDTNTIGSSEELKEPAILQEQLERTETE